MAPPPSRPPGLHTKRSPSRLGIPDLQRAVRGAPPKASKLYPAQVTGFQDFSVFTLTRELAIALHRIFYTFDEIILSFNFSYFLCILVNDVRDTDHILTVKKKKLNKFVNQRVLFRKCSRVSEVKLSLSPPVMVVTHQNPCKSTATSRLTPERTRALRKTQHGRGA